MAGAGMTLRWIPKPQRPLVSPKLRQSARGRDCTVRWHGCDGGGETTVLAHVPGAGSGVGQKGDDCFAVYACHACHDHLDGRRQPRVPAEDILRALNETWRIMLAEKLIVVGGR